VATKDATKPSESIAVPTFSRAGQSTGSISVDPAEFGGKVNKQLLHDVVLMYQANRRAGTHSTLRRGEVAGSTKKLFRQKGTGNARVGTRRTNKRRGGGTAKMLVVGGEYNLGWSRLLRYPEEFGGEGPELTTSFFADYASVNSLDPDFDGRKMYKFGTEVSYRFFSWLAASVRVDRVVDFERTHRAPRGRGQSGRSAGRSRPER
jgi:hypothetical protein